MKIYIPNCYAQWLQTTPTEGQVLLVALVTNFAYIYGLETYLEFETTDLDIVNHTAPQGQNQYQIKELVNQGVLESVKGLNGHSTIRLSQTKTTGLARQSIYTDSIAWNLSLHGTLIWTYLLGRLANIDAEHGVSEIALVREYENSDKNKKYRKDNKEKSHTTHIIPTIYREQVGYGFDPLTIGKRNIIKGIDRKKYHSDWYEARKAEILAKKKAQYAQKKLK